MSAPQTNPTTGNSGTRVPEFPASRLCAHEVTAVLCLPDADKGYYRGTRFDWSGVVRSLRYAGHRYVDEWFAHHDPLRHDGICGPVDEFTQIGYDEARPGEEFLKIGVGTLRRPEETTPYDRFRLYEIVDPGIREVQTARDSVEFRHRILSDHYGYDYRKTVRLTDGPHLRIEYMLRNLGPSQLAGHVYNHNFFTLDRIATGCDTEILLPFRPEGNWREPYRSVALTPDGIAFSRDLRPGESVFMGDLHGHDPASESFGFAIRNRRTGAGVEVSGSGRLSHTVFWACPTVACLEPYVPFKIFPGEMRSWHLDYRLLA